MVEQLTVNQRVVGSSPTSGAILKPLRAKGFSFSGLEPKRRHVSTPVSTVLAKALDEAADLVCDIAFAILGNVQVVRVRRAERGVTEACRY